MAYFKTTVKAGATIEVTKSFTKRVGVKNKRDKEKPTTEEMEKVNEKNAERTLRLKINANFGVDDLFTTLTYRKDERPTPEQAKKNVKKLIDSLLLDGELRETQTANYFSDVYPIDCTVSPANALFCRKNGTLLQAGNLL